MKQSLMITINDIHIILLNVHIFVITLFYLNHTYLMQILNKECLCKNDIM